MPDAVDISEAIEYLDEVPRRIVQRGLRPAIAAAGKVLADEVRLRTPRSRGPTKKPHLADSIVVDVDVDEQQGSAVAEIGFGKEGYRAFFLEYGTRHASARPVLRPAVDAAEEQVRDAFVASLEEALNQEFE